MPEQSFAPPTPGQLPLSRWIAHIERTAICFPWANVKSLCASGMVATSVRRGWGGSLRRGGATLPASFRLRLLVLGGAALVVLDLLEDLAHAGPHQLACLDC